MRTEVPDRGRGGSSGGRLSADGSVGCRDLAFLMAVMGASVCAKPCADVALMLDVDSNLAYKLSDVGKWFTTF